MRLREEDRALAAAGAAQLGEEFPILSSGISSDERPLSRVIALEDWDDARWSCHQNSAPDQKRGDPGAWERTQICYGLDRCGCLNLQTRILVAATMPDETIGALSELVGQVEVLDLLHVSPRSGAEARLFWSGGAYYARDRLLVHERSVGFADLDAGAYDAVVFPHGALFCGGVAGVARVLEMAERTLKLGGVQVFKAEILAGNEPDVHHLDASLIGENGLAAQLEATTGLVPDGGFDARLTGATIGRGARPGDAAPLFVVHDGRIGVPSVWFLTKRRQTARGGWARFGDWLIDRLVGDQLRRLHVGPAGRREGVNRIITNDVGSGCIFYGPYIALPSGKYEVAVTVEAPPGSRRGRVRLDVSASGTPLVEQLVRLEGGPASARLQFGISPEIAQKFAEIEIRAWADEGGAAFTECRLTRAPD